MRREEGAHNGARALRDQREVQRDPAVEALVPGALGVRAQERLDERHRRPVEACEVKGQHAVHIPLGGTSPVRAQ